MPHTPEHTSGLAVGTEVYSEDGDRLGTVKEVRGQHFKVDARMQPDYWLPMTAVRPAADGRLTVMADAERVDNVDETTSETDEVRMRDTHDHTAQTSATHTSGESHTHATTGRYAAEGTAEGRVRADYDRDDDRSIELREERLRVEKEREQAGTVRLGKQVTEHEETVNVPVREERVVIERTPGSGQATGREISGQDETIEVPVERERVNVAKDAVVAEEVNVRKEATERTEQVQETVRKEELEVDDQTGRVSRRT